MIKSPWALVLTISISHCDIFCSLFATRISYPPHLHESERFCSFRASGGEKLDKSFKRSKRNVDSNLFLRGGSSTEHFDRLKVFQEKASVLLQAAGGEMNVSAFLDQWSETYRDEFIQWYSFFSYLIRTNSKFMTIYRYMRYPNTNVVSLMKECEAFTVIDSKNEVKSSHSR
jgi:hypothetical protein